MLSSQVCCHSGEVDRYNNIYTYNFSGYHDKPLFKSLLVEAEEEIPATSKREANN